MQRVLCASVLAIGSVTAMGQATAPEPDGVSSVDTSAVFRTKEGIPSFSELLWNDLFGVEYIEENSVLFLKRDPASANVALHPVQAIDGVWQLGDEGQYIAGYEQLDENFDLFEQDIVLPADDGSYVYIFSADIAFNVVVADVVGSTGATWTVSGFVYDVYFDFLSPPEAEYSYSVFVPLDRHMTMAEGIEYAEGYLDPTGTPRTLDNSDCGDKWGACLTEAQEQYQTDLDLADLTSVWDGSAAGAGGTVAGGLGGFVGFAVGAWPGAAIGGGIGTFLGSIGGGLIGGHTNHAHARRGATLDYNARVSKCQRCWDWCIEHGEWPSWCSGF